MLNEDIAAIISATKPILAETIHAKEAKEGAPVEVANFERGYLEALVQLERLINGHVPVDAFVTAHLGGFASALGLQAVGAGTPGLIKPTGLQAVGAKP